MSRSRAPTILDYPTPQTNRLPWGPFLFRPSRSTTILALLTALAATCLALHHDPWQQLSRFKVPDANVRFTASGRLRTLGKDAVHVYEPRTGYTIHTLHFDPLRGGDRLAENGDQILIVREDSNTATLLDLATGQQHELRLPVPPAAVMALAADPPRIIARTKDPSHTSACNLHHLPLSPTNATPLIRLPAEGAFVDFSPDARRILIVTPTDGGSRSVTLTLCDASSGQPVGEPIVTAYTMRAADYFASPNWLLIPRTDGSPGIRVDLYNAQDARRLREMTGPILRATFGGSGRPDGRTVFSDDGARFAPPSVSISPYSLDVFDTRTGAAAAPKVQLASPTRPIFFPHSHRLLANLATDRALAWAIIDPYTDQPLAILPNARPYGAASLSPDHSLIAIRDQGTLPTVTTYEPAGLLCPPSPLGALVFPHTWLTILLFTALILSLARDARRARPIDAQPVNRFLTTAFLTIVAAQTLLLLLALCLRRDLSPHPAPLALIAAIGLLTYSRVWRLITLIVFACNLPLCAYNLYRQPQIARTGNPYLWTPLDRAYVLPTLTPSATLIIAMALTTFALVLLALRPRPIAR